MKPDKAKIGIVFVLVLLLFSTLTLFYWAFVRDSIIVPVYYFIWVSDLTLKSIPQEAYLAVLMLISIIIDLNTLMGIRTNRYSRRIEGSQPQTDSRYLYWKKLCSNLYASPFARDTFAWEARKLTLSVFAHQNGVESSDVETMIRNGTLPVPDSIKMLIQQKKIQAPKPTYTSGENVIIRLRRLLLKEEHPNNPQTDSPIEEIVAFIEHLLEIDNARNQPQS